MGHDQNHLDLPVLLEVRHALDEAGEDAPPELLRAAEQGCAELGSNLPEPPNGGELNLLVRLLGDMRELLA